MLGIIIHCPGKVLHIDPVWLAQPLFHPSDQISLVFQLTQEPDSNFDPFCLTAKKAHRSTVTMIVNSVRYVRIWYV